MKADLPYYWCRDSIDRNIILNEAARRGIEIEPFPQSQGYFLLTFKGHKEILGYLNTSSLGWLAGRISKNKRHTKWLLRKEGVKTPIGDAFKKGEEGKISDWVAEKKVIVKPNKGACGKNVYLCKDAYEAIQAAKEIWNSGSPAALVEEFFPGKEYRVFATREGFVAVCNRVPANVIGDGRSTIEDLVEEKNKDRGPPEEHYVWLPIKIDNVVIEFLESRGKNLKYVPKEGEQVFLRANSNLSTGGDSITIPRESLDKKVEDIAMRCLFAVPGMAYAGIDLICEDIRGFDDYRVIEINKSPGMTNHHYPNFGEPQNAAGALIDQIFPETRGL